MSLRAALPAWTPVCGSGTRRSVMKQVWSVAIRPGDYGPVVSCQSCGRVSGSSRDVRSAAFGHLAEHARREALPQHLRVCRCSEQGCRWHRGRGRCHGTLELVLVRSEGGRRWTLVEACLACARATEQAAVIPSTVQADRRTLAPGVSPPLGYRHGDAQRRRVAYLLNYLASALDPAVGAHARLLAVQCALRASRAGGVRLPAGLLRGMGVHRVSPWRELEFEGWLRRAGYQPASSCSSAVEAQVLDGVALLQSPGRADRARSADWALRTTARARHLGASASEELLLLVLAAHVPPGAKAGDAELEKLARCCAMPAVSFPHVLRALHRKGVATSWSVTLDMQDVSWSQPVRVAVP
ncbi:hypothetical protein EES41_05750 [Streptomyces sp. ADI95-16]|nr:hypothetical protein EES41_05750 [Streptomyces sp. ADI95-16]